MSDENMDFPPVPKTTKDYREVMDIAKDDRYSDEFVGNVFRAYLRQGSSDV